MALPGVPGIHHCRLPSNFCSPAITRSLPPFALKAFHRRMLLSVRSRAVSAPTSGSIAPAILVTDKALNHLSKMRSEKSEDLCLRIGVKQGGCSGMSYTMEFENRANTRSDDSIIEYNGFMIVCDPKSLLYLYGMQLDFSDALIGGGFSFQNPNASKTCGCGKSFAAAGQSVDLSESSNNHCGA
ncbi:Iron-sulfur assembly protein IscA, chloroplastic [Apostasia shenzhenica]|uniref:Iron-sulfur assembly protein IscA, chloroplastic n=1 Tax=Apostasia shenzhenica TaxID=1088818 RepID=A0A2I0B6E6_9ASPA|nr:Iron-sulfur assembly protein IscA, chloroplastic [Apostasia shenzhenica]